MSSIFRRLPALLLVVAAHAPAAGAQELYYASIAQVNPEVAYAAPQREDWLARVELQPAGRGHSVRVQPLWTRQRDGDGPGLTSLALDAGDETDARLLQTLARGVDYTLDRALAVQATTLDQEGLAQVLQADEARAALMPLPRFPLDPLPWPLPARLQPGQSLQRAMDSALYGPLAWQLQVLTVTDAQALLSLSLQSDKASLQGRLAVRRSDGMPLELRLRGTLAPAGYARTVAMQLVRLDSQVKVEPVEPGPQREAPVDLYAARLQHPPFTTPSQDPDDYEMPLAEGALAPWMLAPEALAPMEDSLRFALHRGAGAGRPLLVIGGQFGADAVPSAQGGPWMPPVVTTQLQQVVLCDVDGQPLPGVEPVLLPTSLILAGRERIDEAAAPFPFRLPPALPAAALQPLDHIRMDVAVDTYAWDSAEVVARGDQSRVNPEARLDWQGPQRLRLLQSGPRSGQTQGLWTLVVPLDAQGRALASAQLSLRDEDAGAGGEPLDWERQRQPQRQEVAAAAPVAAVRLQHYRWQSLPRQWTFRDARAEGGR